MHVSCQSESGSQSTSKYLYPVLGREQTSWSTASILASLHSSKDGCGRFLRSRHLLHSGRDDGDRFLQSLDAVAPWSPTSCHITIKDIRYKGTYHISLKTAVCQHTSLLCTTNNRRGRFQLSCDHYTRLKVTIKWLTYIPSQKAGFPLPLPMPSSLYYVTDTKVMAPYDWPQEGKVLIAWRRVYLK